MNPKLLKLAQLMAKRPSNRILALMQICAGLLFILIGYFARDAYQIDFPGIHAENEVYFKYALAMFGLAPLVIGMTRMCVFRHATLRKLQIGFGIVFILIGLPIMDPLTPTEISPPVYTETLELGQEIITVDIPHNPGWAIALLGFGSLLFGITGKGTYSHCIKYKERITKIRV